MNIYVTGARQWLSGNMTNTNQILIGRVICDLLVKDCDMVILNTLDKGHIKLVAKKNGIWRYMES
jgi:hypothetical protein